MENNNNKRIKLSEREDNVILSTIRAIPIELAWYGPYETAVSIDEKPWRILESYDTEKEAIKGHEKYMSMSKEHLSDIDAIG